MTINTEVTKKYDNGYVQVKVTAGRTPARYYKLPEQELDTFEKEYKRGSKKMEWSITGLALLGGFVGMIPAYFLSKKLVKNSVAQFLINVGTGFIGCMAGSSIGGKSALKDYNTMLENHNAEEVEPPKQGLPI